MLARVCRASALHARARPALLPSGRRPLHVTRATSSTVMPAEAQELIKAEGYKYLDVRTPAEFSAGHAPAAVNVDVFDPDFVAGVQRAFPDKAESLLVGCKAGRRSLTAIGLLSQAGYTDLVNLTGGFDLWAAQGLPLEA
ncbi:Thiosulfate sulfurtransferase 16, chloroplastic [Tetrabaena socialis]|uniref:Thiosulfate sulfurtransferase 16, chloroplastic n=1 Tax=Tetrabaena socialis TaxID=47790 RepID=A0A2J7ZSM1_9CHLO|nr:Thiosulfate sulfurtransferase 16, chloroplastic [Tetrabaena socialis]|eukprot:PNH03271.1 Thiosulfate sulfurtransferase 16, chloroplastic [Tetrabaena socialis]